jgi:hypothetical protein
VNSSENGPVYDLGDMFEDFAWVVTDRITRMTPDMKRAVSVLNYAVSLIVRTFAVCYPGAKRMCQPKRNKKNKTRRVQPYSFILLVTLPLLGI